MERWEIDDLTTLDIGEEVRAVRVRLIGGDVAVTAGPGPAQVEAERIHGRPIEVTIDNGVLTVGYDDDWSSGDWWDRLDRLTCIGRDEAGVVITVPAATEVEVSVVSARLAVRGLEGRVRARSVSGGITLDDLDGDVDVNTASGDVDARALAGRLRSTTVSGELTLAAGRCPALEARAVSGDLVVDLALDRHGRYELGTVSGDVAVRVDDEEPDLNLSVSTMSGRIDSAFPLEGDRGRVGRRAWGRVGEGGADLRVKTLSGSVTLVGPGRR